MGRLKKLEVTISTQRRGGEGRWCQVQRSGWTYDSSKKVSIDFFFFFCQNEINGLRGLLHVSFASPLTRLSV